MNSTIRVKQMQFFILAFLLLGAGYILASVVSNKECMPLRVDRKADYPINNVFLNRRSAYALSGEAITDEELMTLFEAARWAPSSYNSQPWRFVYAKKDSASWNKLFDLLVDFNKQWVANASALILIVSRNNFTHNDELSVTHSFDAGSAWENLALQATFMGLVAHGMSGFDYERARKELNIPQGYTVEAMVAVGKPAHDGSLPEELIKRDKKVSERMPLNELVFEGTFKS